jgi:hypothetical protein
MADKPTKPRRAVMRRITMETPKPEREARVRQWLSAGGYGNGANLALEIKHELARSRAFGRLPRR